MRLGSAGTKLSVRVPKRRKQPANIPKAEKQCDRCSFRGTPADVAKHSQEHLSFDERLEVARREVARNRPKLPPPEPPPVVRCIFCKKTFDLDAYEQHRPCAAAAPRKKIPQGDPKRKQPIYKRPNALRPCEYCGAMLLPLPLKHHKKREHRDQNNASDKSMSSSQTKKVSKASRRSPKVVGPARPAGSGRFSDSQKIKGMDEWKQKLATAFNEISERKLDRTRGYGHFSRENGRFGSHPSHDGFDDESSS